MDILKLLSDLAASIEALKASLVNAQGQLDVLSKAKYDEGFAAGVASVGVGDKLYSQIEVDAMLMPVKAELEALKADLPNQINAAIAALKSEILAKVDILEHSPVFEDIKKILK